MNGQENQASELDVENIVTHLFQAIEVQLRQTFHPFHDEQPFMDTTFHL
jgi:hypothetical protein